MMRKIVHIDQEKCVGCGLCAKACHEDAIAMVDGKAKLIRDDYCDGLGNCLPACPVNAISIIEREADPFDKAAVNQKRTGNLAHPVHPAGGCPGRNVKMLDRKSSVVLPAQVANVPLVQSELMQWPVQIKLVPVNAPYFDGAHLLIAADCTAFAYGKFHQEFIRRHITLIGCPKLDEGDYSEKLTEILRHNQIKCVKVVRMEVPCCGGIERAVVQALMNCGKMIPWQVVVISTDGRIVED